MREVATIRYCEPHTGHEGPRNKETEIESAEGGGMKITVTSGVIRVIGEGEEFYVPVEKLLSIKVEVEE